MDGEKVCVWTVALDVVNMDGENGRVQNVALDGVHMEECNAVRTVAQDIVSMGDKSACVSCAYFLTSVHCAPMLSVPRPNWWSTCTCTCTKSDISISYISYEIYSNQKLTERNYRFCMMM